MIIERRPHPTRINRHRHGPQLITGRSTLITAAVCTRSVSGGRRTNLIRPAAGRSLGLFVRNAAQPALTCVCVCVHVT